MLTTVTKTFYAVSHIQTSKLTLKYCNNSMKIDKFIFRIFFPFKHTNDAKTKIPCYKTKTTYTYKLVKTTTN